MKEANDRNFGLMKLVLLKQIRKNVKSKHSLHIGFYSFISSLGHISDQIEVFNKVFPG